MHVFIANFCDVATLEAEQDDPDFRLEHMASPQLFSISASLTEAWIESLKADVINEMGDFCDEDEDHKELVWKTDGWKVPKQGREHQTWAAYVDEEPTAMLIVQKEPVLP